MLADLRRVETEDNVVHVLMNRDRPMTFVELKRAVMDIAGYRIEDNLLREVLEDFKRIKAVNYDSFFCDIVWRKTAEPNQ